MLEVFKIVDILSLLNSDLFNGVANISQVYDVALNLKQVSNDEIMKELQNQDKFYLVKCIEQNEQIIQLNKEIIDKLNMLLGISYSEGQDNVD